MSIGFAVVSDVHSPRRRRAQGMAQVEHALYCFDVLHAHLASLPAPQPRFLLDDNDNDLDLYVPPESCARTRKLKGRAARCL